MSDIADLIRLAGRRPEPPAFRTARVREAVEAEWRRSVRRRSWTMAWRWGLAAAAVLLLIVWFRPSRSPVTTPTQVATIAQVYGDARLIPVSAPSRSLAGGDRVFDRSAAETDSGARVAIRLETGVSVRMKERSRVVFESASRLRLEQGTIYVDTETSAPGQKRVDVATPLGVVHNLGTRFEVGTDAGALRIRVRSGEVRLDRGESTVDVEAAEGITVHADARVERWAAPPSGAEWAWVEDAPAQFVVEGATLEAFLNWSSGELGLKWRYADRATERKGKSVVLHGSIEGLTPRDALDAVLPTCGMSHRTSRGELIITLAAR